MNYKKTLRFFSKKSNIDKCMMHKIIASKIIINYMRSFCRTTLQTSLVIFTGPDEIASSIFLSASMEPTTPRRIRSCSTHFPFTTTPVCQQPAHKFCSRSFSNQRGPCSKGDSH